MVNPETQIAGEYKARFSPRVRALLWITAAIFAIPVIVVIYQWITWPNVGRLVTQNPTTTAFIDAYRHRAETAGRAGVLQWQWVDWNDISPNIKAAVLVSEDIEFFWHEGFSMSEIRAAIKQAFESGGAPRGASTLTQQLAKNLWLSPSRNPIRKVKEALLTMQLERTLSKDRLFEIYLNVAEFGPGIYGVESASEVYFSKSATYVTRGEATLLAASLTRPSSWNPLSTSPGYRARANRIDDLMTQHKDFLERRVGLVPGQLATTPF